MAKSNAYYINVLQQIPGESACIHTLFLYVFTECDSTVFWIGNKLGAQKYRQERKGNQRLIESILFIKAVERL